MLLNECLYCSRGPNLEAKIRSKMQDLIIKLVRKPSFSIYKPPEQQSVIPHELLLIKIGNEICPQCYGDSEV